jgi:hypothetical protein
MRRELGKFETAAALSGEYAIWNIVGVLLLDVLPTPEIIRQALNILQDRHALLNVRLIIEKGRHYFESGDVSEIHMEILDCESDNHWVQKAEDELNYKFNHPTGPLLKCTVLKKDDGVGEIILAAQHSIVDGASMEILFHELMDISAKIESGSEITGYDSLEPLPPMEQFFPPGFQGFGLSRKTLGYFLRQMGDEFKYQFSLRRKRKPPINLNPRGRIIQIQTPKVTTALLASRARKERVTLNSITNAAVLLSVQKHLYAGEEMSYRYMSMADMRPYLDPVPSSDQVVSYISPLRYTIRILAGDDLWSLTHRINEQIYTSAKRGEKFLASVMAQQFLRMTFTLKKFRMCTTAISYGGASKFKGEYGPYKIKGLRGFVSNFGLGPEFSGRVEMHDDELWWDMIYLDSDMDHEGAQQIANDVSRILEQAVS